MVAVGKQIAAVYADVAAVHLAVAGGARAAHAGGALSRGDAVHQLLVIDQVLLAVEALATGAADHQAAALAALPLPAPLLLAGGGQVGGPGSLPGTRHVPVAAEMAAERP